MSKELSADEIGNLLTQAMERFDRAYMECIGTSGKVDDMTGQEVADRFRRAYKETLDEVCAALELSDDDWECIFDVDRPVEEWKGFKPSDFKCRWCGRANRLDCDCEERRTCDRPGEFGHRQCGQLPCGCPIFCGCQCNRDL